MGKRKRERERQQAATPDVPVEPTDTPMVTVTAPDGTTARVPTTVQIGGDTVRLAPPVSPTVRYELLRALRSNPLRGNAAVLGACWRGPGAPKVKYSACQYNPVIYGQQVLDELLGRGVTMQAIVSAAAVAAALVSDQLPGLGGVQNDVDFSAGREASTS